MDAGSQFAESFGRFLAEALHRTPELTGTAEFVLFISILAPLDSRASLLAPGIRESEIYQEFRAKMDAFAGAMRKEL
jgi:hypothetical protein